MPTPIEILTYLGDKAGAAYLPLPLVFWPIPVGIPFWIIFLWTRATERQIWLREQPSSAPDTEFDKGSWPLINYGWRLIRLCALFLAFITPPWVEGNARIALYCFGLMLMISGTLLRGHCFRILGEHFTYTVRVSDKSDIIKRGIYKWLRHPSYTGGMLYNLGIGLALTNWESTMLVATAMFIIYFYRVRVEERALLSVHKSNYREYMQHTKRFVPFIF